MTPERFDELRHAAPPGSLAAGWLAECLNYIKAQAAVITDNAMLLVKQEDGDVARASLVAELTLDRDSWRRQCAEQMDDIRRFAERIRELESTRDDAIAIATAASSDAQNLKAELARVQTLATALNRNNRSW